MNNEILHPWACVILVTVVGLYWICFARGDVLYKLHVFPRADQISMVITRDDLHVQIIKSLWRPKPYKARAVKHTRASP